ncbi:MAG: methenyltetrahydromethanopterin cyclohydrolase [Planctomycetes bacterium]|nr:methenyltetrahydromethanopterin cyclohydrolase [Planctomycetota bacterium]
MPASLSLNHRAYQLVSEVTHYAEGLGVKPLELPRGARGFDFGIQAQGGLSAGAWLARVCLANLGTVGWKEHAVSGTSCPLVCVRSEYPVQACMGSQYAGWQIASGKYFAIGSGPMRALYGAEPLFDVIGCREKCDVALGVLETRQFPSAEVVDYLADKLHLPPQKIYLFLAPTASMAGGFQVVARSVETALHKLLELGFDLHRVVCGEGSAPMPPVAKDDLAAIGRTNDAILYGASVKLRVRGDDASLETIGPKTPSSASPDYGDPFSEIFKRYNHDFYKIDKLLFSPAEITFENVDTGRSFQFGSRNIALLERSFFQ